MKKYFMPAMAAFIFILLFSLHIHASEPSAPADGYSKQISENYIYHDPGHYGDDCHHADISDKQYS